jgi:hypothetical protein
MGIPSYSAFMDLINLRAVLLATLAVFGIDVISSMVLIAVFGGPMPEPGDSDEQLRAALELLNQNGAYLATALVFGTASTVFGGYLAARLAGSMPYFNSLAFGLLGVIIGVALSGDMPLWFTILGIASTIPAALVGGHIAKRQMNANSS